MRVGGRFLVSVMAVSIVAGTLHVLAPATRATEEVLHTLTGPTMGTRYVIKYVGGAEPEQIESRVTTRLERINALMSTYLPDSEVTRFNNAAADAWFPVSAETFRVVNRAQEISRQTKGAFDITVGPLIRLWKFGVHSKGTVTELPSASEVLRARAITGYEKLEVRSAPPALRKQVAELEIDLSGIAKGYAVDELCQILSVVGASSFMVEIGGEVRVHGKKPDGLAWRIGIETPHADKRDVHQVLKLENTALATSGDYRNFFEVGGRRYSHTIDPATGRPVNHRLAAVSVTEDTCISADAFATAILVMGPRRGLAWAEVHGVAALLLSRDGDSVQELVSSHFKLPQRRSNESHQDAVEYLHTITLSALIIGVAVGAMAIGVVLRRKSLAGSCGGMAGLKDEGGNPICEACAHPSPECQGPHERVEPVSK